MKFGRKDYQDHFDSDIVAEDEPVFVIRGKDQCSGDAVRAWADLAEKAGADPIMIANAKQHAQRMDDFRLKSLPDMPVT